MSQLTPLQLTADITAKLDIASSIGELVSNGMLPAYAFWAMAAALAGDAEWETAYAQGTQWILPFQNHDTINKAVKTLDVIHKLHDSGEELSACAREALASAACRVALVLERASESVKSKLVWEGAEPEAGGGASVAAVTSVHQQLAAAPTLRALARAATYVRKHTWPDTVAERQAAVVREPVPSRLLGPVQRLANGVTSQAYTLTRECGTAGASLLCVVSWCIRDALDVVAVPKQRQRTPDPTPAPRLVAALHDSGVLEALCAAILAAPPYPAVPPDGTVTDSYVLQLTSTVWNVMNILQLLSHSALPFAKSAKDILSGPAVQRMRWALLEQVAATAPGGCGELVVPNQDRHEGGTEGKNVQTGEDRGQQRSGGQRQGGGDEAVWPLFQRKISLDMDMRFAIARALEAAAPYGDLGLFTAAATTGGVREAPGAQRAAPDTPSRPQAAVLAARVVRALCARAEYLGVDGAVDGTGKEGGLPVGAFAMHGEYMESAVETLLRGATAAELEACAPDVMALLGWQLRLLATPMGLAGPGPEHAAATLNHMNLTATSRWALAEVQPAIRLETAGLWKALSPAGRAACIRRLLPTRLMRSLDCLLRAELAKGGSSDTHNNPLIATNLAYELLLPLLRARQLEACMMQQQQQPGRRGESASAGASARPGGGGGGGTSGAGGSTDGNSGGGGGSSDVGARGECDPQEDLGLLVTLGKLFRREVAGGCEPMGALPLLQGVWPTTCALAVLAVCGRPPETQTERERAVGVEAGIMSLRGPGAWRRPVREAGALLCRHVLPLMTRIVAASADAMQRCANSAALARAAASSAAAVGGHGVMVADGGGELASLCDQAERFTTALVQAVRNVPPSALLPAQPQRLVASLGRVVSQAERLLAAAAGPSRLNAASFAEARKSLARVRVHLGNLVTLMACDWGLQAACPGWVWGDVPCACTHGLDIEALAAAADSPTLTPPRPVLLLPVFLGSPFPGLRWEQHARHAQEVVALARLALAEAKGKAVPAWARGVVEASEGEDGDDGAPLWPPRRLRLCGNPRCGNFGGPAEAELKLRSCGGCRAVRYCGAACQREHWVHEHKEECRRG